ncbi:MAG: hypothetical protein HC801_02185 [Nitrospira sp.]|nr:hypothetical protein [Nitrospira sp.]
MAVDSVEAVAVPVESAIVGKRLPLIKTPNGFSGPALPNPLLDGITRRGGPESHLKRGDHKAASGDGDIERFTFRLGTPPSL